MKNNLVQLSKDYERIEKAIHFLEQDFQSQPDLHDVAEAVGMSDYHFQRVFQRWAGISPKKFLQFLTKEYAKQLLKTSNVLEASHDAGLSGPGRLHDLFVTYEAVSPGEYKRKGEGLVIAYGFHPSPFGECFVAVTSRGICSLRFLVREDREDILKDFLKDWKSAECVHDQVKTAKLVERIFAAGSSKTGRDPIQVLCSGTNFQVKVWEALLRIPSGTTVSYQTLARWAGSPKAVRAVGTAVGKNPVAYLIPCHRVIRSAGQLGGYRWGLSRKKAILARETAATSDDRS